MSAVTILAARYGDRLYITYLGLPADLVALGYPTAEMCAAGKHGKRRLDPQGREFTRVKHANGRVSVSVDCEPLEGLSLPGVFRALDEFSDLDPRHVGSRSRGFWLRDARADLEGIDVGPLLERFKRGPRPARKPASEFGRALQNLERALRREGYLDDGAVPS